MIGTLRLPARVHFGSGAREQIAALVAEHGRRVLAVVDPFLLDTPVLHEILAALAARSIRVRICSDIQPELPIASLDRAAIDAREFEPEAILAIGGGSALDAAKLIGVLVAHGGPLSRYYGENLVPGPIAPLVAVPTTAGTGSEVTPVAVVSDPDREIKVGISSPHLVPLAAVVDPELTLGAPAGVTAFSGIDALVHLAESYTARPQPADWSGALPMFTGRNVFSDLLALEGIATMAEWLPRATESPGDLEARERVAFASLVGGISFGSTGTHLSHALQYPIGAMTKTPHGLGTGLMLPHVLRALAADPSALPRVARIGVALGSTAVSAAEQAADASAALARLNRDIGVPATLADIGVTRDQLPRIADLALGARRLVDIAPIPVDRAVLLDILDRAHGAPTPGGTS